MRFEILQGWELLSSHSGLPRRNKVSWARFRRDAGYNLTFSAFGQGRTEGAFLSCDQSRGGGQSDDRFDLSG